MLRNRFHLSLCQTYLTDITIADENIIVSIIQEACHFLFLHFTCLIHKLYKFINKEQEEDKRLWNKKFFFYQFNKVQNSTGNLLIINSNKQL